MISKTGSRTYRDSFAVILRDRETQEAMKFDKLSEPAAMTLIRDAKRDGLELVLVLAPIRYFN